MIKPILVFGYGNLSRGDDAVGPLVLEYLDRYVDPARVELLTDFQLQIEHALDLQGRELVLFVDASVACDQAFHLSRLVPEKDNSYTSHAMSPAALLHVCQNLYSKFPPSFLLSIKASEFELGEALSEATEHHLQQACVFARQLLISSELDDWQSHCTDARTVTA